MSNASRYGSKKLPVQSGDRGFSIVMILFTLFSDNAAADSENQTADADPWSRIYSVACLEDMEKFFGNQLTKRKGRHVPLRFFVTVHQSKNLYLRDHIDVNLYSAVLQLTAGIDRFCRAACICWIFQHDLLGNFWIGVREAF